MVVNGSDSYTGKMDVYVRGYDTKGVKNKDQDMYWGSGHETTVDPSIVDTIRKEHYSLKCP